MTNNSMLQWLYDNLPTIDFPSDWNVQDFFANNDWLLWCNYYLPMDTFAVCAGIVMTATIIFGAIRIVIDLIP